MCQGDALANQNKVTKFNLLCYILRVLNNILDECNLRDLWFNYRIRECKSECELMLTHINLIAGTYILWWSVTLYELGTSRRYGSGKSKLWKYSSSK